MLAQLFKPRPARLAGEALYGAVVQQARSPALYVALGAPDTTEGRFELYSLHVYLILERFKDGGEQAADTAQVLFDVYLSALDNALREMGIGDLGVGKRMRKLGEAFYGRIQSYEQALAALPDQSGLQAILVRTVYAGVETDTAAAMAEYLVAQREALAGQTLDALCAGEIHWRVP